MIVLIRDANSHCIFCGPILLCWALGCLASCLAIWLDSQLQYFFAGVDYCCITEWGSMLHLFGHYQQSRVFLGSAKRDIYFCCHNFYFIFTECPDCTRDLTNQMLRSTVSRLLLLLVVVPTSQLVVARVASQQVASQSSSTSSTCKVLLLLSRLVAVPGRSAKPLLLTLLTTC